MSNDGVLYSLTRTACRTMPARHRCLRRSGLELDVDRPLPRAAPDRRGSRVAHGHRLLCGRHGALRPGLASAGRSADVSSEKLVGTANNLRPEERSPPAGTSTVPRRTGGLAWGASARADGGGALRAARRAGDAAVLVEARRPGPGPGGADRDLHRARPVHRIGQAEQYVRRSMVTRSIDGSRRRTRERAALTRLGHPAADTRSVVEERGLGADVVRSAPGARPRRACLRGPPVPRGPLGARDGGSLSASATAPSSGTPPTASAKLDAALGTTTTHQVRAHVRLVDSMEARHGALTWGALLGRAAEELSTDGPLDDLRAAGLRRVCGAAACSGTPSSPWPGSPPRAWSATAAWFGVNRGSGSRRRRRRRRRRAPALTPSEPRRRPSPVVAAPTVPGVPPADARRPPGSLEQTTPGWVLAIYRTAVPMPG